MGTRPAGGMVIRLLFNSLPHHAFRSESFQCVLSSTLASLQFFKQRPLWQQRSRHAGVMCSLLSAALVGCRALDLHAGGSLAPDPSLIALKDPSLENGRKGGGGGIAEIIALFTGGCQIHLLEAVITVD